MYNFYILSFKLSRLYLYSFLDHLFHLLSPDKVVSTFNNEYIYLSCVYTFLPLYFSLFIVSTSYINYPNSLLTIFVSFPSQFDFYPVIFDRFNFMYVFFLTPLYFFSSCCILTPCYNLIVCILTSRSVSLTSFSLIILLMLEGFNYCLVDV